MGKNLLKLKKAAILAIALIAVSFGVKAQSWYIMGEYLFSPPNPQGTFEELHYQAEDVTIGGLEYHTIYSNGARGLLGAYREDGAIKSISGHLLKAVIGLTGEIVITPAAGRQAQEKTKHQDQAK